MLRFDFGKILLGQAITDGQVGVLGQKTEISYGINLGLVIAARVKLCFGENMMHL